MPQKTSNFSDHLCSRISDCRNMISNTRLPEPLKKPPLLLLSALEYLACSLNKSSQECHEQEKPMPIQNELSEFIAKAQALDNISDDLMYKGEKRISKDDQRSFMSDISTIIINGEKINCGKCIQVTRYSDSFLIQVDTINKDVDGRGSPVLFYFNESLLKKVNEDQFMNKFKSLCGNLKREAEKCATTSLKDFFQKEALAKIRQ